MGECLVHVILRLIVRIPIKALWTSWTWHSAIALQLTWKLWHSIALSGTSFLHNYMSYLYIFHKCFLDFSFNFARTPLITACGYICICICLYSWEKRPHNWALLLLTHMQYFIPLSSLFPWPVSPPLIFYPSLDLSCSASAICTVLCVQLLPVHPWTQACSSEGINRTG